jgi:hypothetical protein
MAKEALKALEMFNELVQRGYIVPASEYPNLKALSIYRSVPSIMTGGSGTGSFSAGGGNAELDSSPEGDSQHKA